MPQSLKVALRYIFIIALVVVLLKISLNNITTEGDETKGGFILKSWQASDKFLLILSALVAIVSHYLRSERWKLLIEPLGYKVGSFFSFLSVMVGYFVNLAIPRGGELARCYNLYRLEKTPVSKSFGTVIAERVVDIIFLLAFIGLSFLVEFQKFIQFFRELEISGNYYLNLGIFLLVGIVLIFISRALLKRFGFYNKIQHFLSGVKQGLLTIFRQKQKGLFIFYSFGIWIGYYIMAYLVVKAFPETDNLGILATLTIFAIGGIAMAIPLPGGLGSYHVLIPLGLVMFYDLPGDKATAFTFIFHGWQTLILIVFGAGSMLISQLISRRNRYERDKRENSEPEIPVATSEAMEGAGE